MQPKCFGVFIGSTIKFCWCPSQNFSWLFSQSLLSNLLLTAYTLGQSQAYILKPPTSLHFLIFLYFMFTNFHQTLLGRKTFSEEAKIKPKKFLSEQSKNPHNLYSSTPRQLRLNIYSFGIKKIYQPIFFINPLTAVNHTQLLSFLFPHHHFSYQSQKSPISCLSYTHKIFVMRFNSPSHDSKIFRSFILKPIKIIMQSL